MAWLRSDGAAPTRASSFLAACGYALHVFGFKDFDSVYNSRRVRGLAEIMHSGKSPTQAGKGPFCCTGGGIAQFDGKQRQPISSTGRLQHTPSWPFTAGADTAIWQRWIV